jgi:cytoskeletal protein RodZ
MNNPVSRTQREQEEVLAGLGSRLKQVRESQSLSLEQMSARTLVSKRMLAAIEQATLEHLPEPVYIQGFIRRYADALGMNGAEFASDFPADVVMTVNRRPMGQNFSVQAQLRPLHLYVLYMVLVGSAVSGLSYVLNRTSSPIVITPPQATIAPTGAPNAPGLPGSAGPAMAAARPAVPANPDAAQKKLVQVAVKFTDQSWIRVMTDGKMNFEGVLPQGTQRLWTADKQIVVRAGNAGGVIVSLNNGQAKPLGMPGSVEEVTFGNNAQASNLPDVPAQTLAISRMPSSF